MNNFQCLSKRRKNDRDDCLNRLISSEVDVYVFDIKSFVELWYATYLNRGMSREEVDAIGVTLGVSESILTRASYGHDVGSIAILARDLHRGGSIFSTFEISKVDGKSYIKFKGNHKLRKVIKGTRYLSSNTKLLSIGIGAEGLKLAAKSGVLLTIFYSVPIYTLKLILQKDYQISRWVADVSFTIVQAALSGVAGVIVAGMVTTTIVIVPLAVGVVAAFLASETISIIENEFLLKDRLTKAINNYVEKEAEKSIETYLRKSQAAGAIKSINQQVLINGL
ncbi:hypothetical protein [Vibrio sp. SCSIO 43136]|uniref:hypothetical protein n=1 Tax=Vibrio sp. SCSIO 43136 TaxID=2819101 RepID=UPI002075FB0F|nr:hypothetical protein [Vibrio sp. SCSIO 43136]USD65782.1 hypothetical protein J4N39_02870 [Vibrio sp. SCSIO 43136]